MLKCGYGMTSQGMKTYDPHSGVCQSILAKSESADVETFAFFIMNEDVEKRHRQ